MGEEGGLAQPAEADASVGVDGDAGDGAVGQRDAKPGLGWQLQGTQGLLWWGTKTGRQSQFEQGLVVKDGARYRR